MEEFPDEIETIWSRTGTAEVATDPMGLEMTDMFITLKPRERWKRAKTQEELVDGDGGGDRGAPRHAGASTPSRSRCGSTRWSRASGPTSASSSSATTWRSLKAKAAEIERVVEEDPRRGRRRRTSRSRASPSCGSRSTGRPSPATASRPRQVLDAVAAAGGIAVGEILEPGAAVPAGRPAPARLPRRPGKPWSGILITTASGQRLPLTHLARFEETQGPSTIQREWGQRRIVVQANVRGRDIGSFVEEAQARIGREVELPDRLHDRVGRPVREPERARAAALPRRAAGPGR